jgi:hypothetical protein
MFDAQGRYASPRHFSRSVYSAIASQVAIHFGIKGPCQTLAFKDPVKPALRQARRILRHVDRVLIIWADQSGEIAADLASRAVRDLHLKEYARYQPCVGQGAVAVVAGPPSPNSSAYEIDIETPVADHPHAARPFPTDAALSLAAAILKNSPPHP